MERLRLPQPPFEVGDKTLPAVVARRAIRGWQGAPDVINSTLAPFLATEIRDLQSKVESATTHAEQFLKPAWQLLESNAFYFPNELFVRASPFHCDNWLRDTFIGTLFLELPEVEMKLLSQFEDQRTHPQIPTTRLLASNRAWAFDDESTMLALIWRAKLLAEGVSLSWKERHMWQERWGWIQRHVQDGLYISPAGTEHSWLDTFRLPKPDVITYNQGIYATAVIATKIMALFPNGGYGSLAEAKNGYRGLIHDSGRLKFSKNYSHKDASALFGEFLAAYLFGFPHLPDKTAIQTVESLPRLQGGYPVLAREDNAYLEPSDFNRPYQPGDYHNGAEWPAFSATAQAVAEIHGSRHDRQFWQDLFTRLRETHHAEYIYTNQSRGVSARHNPARENYLWNTVAYKAASLVLGKEEIATLTQMIVGARPEAYLYSEAAQMPDSTL